MGTPSTSATSPTRRCTGECRGAHLQIHKSLSLIEKSASMPLEFKLLSAGCHNGDWLENLEMNVHL